MIGTYKQSLNGFLQYFLKILGLLRFLMTNTKGFKWAPITFVRNSWSLFGVPTLVRLSWATIGMEGVGFGYEKYGPKIITPTQ